jgi:hypothetical protein
MGGYARCKASAAKALFFQTNLGTVETVPYKDFRPRFLKFDYNIVGESVERSVP